MDRAEIERWVGSAEASLKTYNEALAAIRDAMDPADDGRDPAMSRDLLLELSLVIEDEISALDQLQPLVIRSDDLKARGCAVKLKLVALLMEVHLTTSSTQVLN